MRYKATRIRLGLSSLMVLLLLVMPNTPAVAAEVVPIIGSASGIVMDSFGETAYIGTRSSVLVVDVMERRIEKQFQLTIDVDEIGGIDEADRLISLYGFSRAGTLDVVTGSQEQVISASAIYGSAIVNDVLYAPSFNNRALIVKALDGSFQKSIKPFGESGLTACPNSLALPPDRSLVAFGDECQDALHIVDPQLNEVVQTIAVGVDPDLVVMPNSNEAIILNPYEDAAIFIDLTKPLAYPGILPLPGLSWPRGAALDFAGNRLFVGHEAPKEVKQRGKCPVPLDEDAVEPEIIVIDLTTRTEIERFRIDQIDLSTQEPAYLGGIAVTPDGQTLIVAGDDLFFVDLTVPCKNGKKKSKPNKKKGKICRR